MTLISHFESYSDDVTDSKLVLYQRSAFCIRGKARCGDGAAAAAAADVFAGPARRSQLATGHLRTTPPRGGGALCGRIFKTVEDASFF